MAQNKLTDAKLNKYLGKEQERQLTLADGLGLSARISRVGGITWLFRFRLPTEANQVWLSLGSYPALSLKSARTERDKCRAWIANGKDPRFEYRIDKEESLKPLTVKDALEHWLDKYADRKRVNAMKHRQQFQRWILPQVGHLPIASISKRQWLACFENRAAQYPVAAGYVLRNIQQALKFCSKRGYEINKDIFELDFEAIGASKQAKRSRRLVDESSWDEFKQLVNWIEQGNLQPYYRALLTVLISFGCRTQEVRLSKIDEWDFDAMIWTVPPEHNKTSAKDMERGATGEIKRPIPLSMRAFLQGLVNSSANGYLLGELKSSPAVSAWGGKLWQRLGHQSKWHLHDLRRTVATGMNDLGVSPHVVESLLGHSIQGIAGIYNRSQYLPEKKEALDLWLGKLVELRSR
ncbi:tyrosine-type recombinase/integrase [Shewanella gaetbuli]